MLLIAFLQGANAREESETDYKEQQVDVNEIVFGHIGDSYEWHITDIGDTPIAIPPPGKKGINPIRLLIRIKKKAVSR